jgi:hypothetical protein
MRERIRFLIESYIEGRIIEIMSIVCMIVGGYHVKKAALKGPNPKEPSSGRVEYEGVGLRIEKQYVS